MKNISKMNEWDLAVVFKNALGKEDYELCAELKKEVERRIANGTIDKQLMQGFKYWDLKKKQFVGASRYKSLNGLFDNYKE